MAGQSKTDSELLAEIRSDLAVVKNDIAHLKETVDDQMEDVQEIVKKLREEIYGNGNPSPGLRAEVRSLSEWKDAQIWWQRAIIVAVIVEAIGLVKLIFFG